MYDHGHHQLHCLHCRPQEYIRMVQHLIERCLLFHMSRDDCIRALAEHANIEPVVTLAVWKELLKENEGFFQAYFHAISPGQYFTRKPYGIQNQKKTALEVMSRDVNAGGTLFPYMN